MSEPIAIMTNQEMLNLLCKAFKLNETEGVAGFVFRLHPNRAELVLFLSDNSVEEHNRPITPEVAKTLDFLEPRNMIAGLEITSQGGTAGSPVQCRYTTYVDSAFTKPFLNFLDNL